MPKILQLGSTNLVVVKYEEENIFPISFFYPLQANICKKNWAKIHISVQNADLLKITKKASTQ